MNLPLTIIPNSDGTYTVVSNIFNIITEGSSLEEAIKNGQEALQCHIEGLKKGDYDYDIYSNFDRSFSTFVNV